jgi:hypothetical protein
VCMYWKFDVLPEWIRPRRVGQRGGRTPALQNSWRFVFSCARRCALLADLKRRSAIDRGSTLHAAAADGSCRNNSVPARFHRSPGEFAALVGEFSATACAESVKGTVAGRNERTAVGECTRCRDFSVQATTTLERTRFACIYAVARRHVSPGGGVGRQFVRRFHHHVFARRLADDIRVVRAGRPSVRRSIVAVDRLARRSASLRAARYRRSFRRRCDRPTTDFRGMCARNFDGICSVPVISPRNLATKFLGTTRRMSLFDPCFRRKNPPVNGRAAIFFRFFFHRFRRGYPLERPFTEGFRAFAACGLLDFFPFRRDRPRPDPTPGTPLSRILQAVYTCTEVHGLCGYVRCAYPCLLSCCRRPAGGASGLARLRPARAGHSEVQVYARCVATAKI